MKTTNLLLLGAVAGTLAFTSCTPDKTAETTTTVTTPTAGDTAVVINNDEYQDRAGRITDRLASDLDLTDSVVVTKVRTVYYTRAQRLADLNKQYATDTAGHYAAARAVNVEADNSLRTALNSPDKYRLYETNRLNYADERYVNGDPAPVVVTPATTTKTTATTVRSSGGPRKAIKKLENDDDNRKVKYTDGSKRKVSKDGDVKIKRADGTKVKIDADGERTVKRF
jgi:hypothetical protein